MVIWGAIWGAMLGLLWDGHDWEFQSILGALLGTLAGWMLRRAVRKEVLRSLAQARAPAPSTGARINAAPADAAADDTRAGPVVAAPREPIPARPAQAPGAAVPAMAAAAPAPAQAAAPVAATPAPAHAPALPPTPREPGLVTRLVLRARDWLFGGNTVVRMGVLVLFVGLAFLAKYAVDHALLPPQLRLAGIACAGIALFVFGFRLRRNPARSGYAMTLQGAGIAVLYLTVFAAFRLYHFLPAAAAFGALAAICLFSAVIALAQNALPLAFIGFAGGYAAPILVSTGDGNHVSLFSYYLLLGAAIAAIAWVKAWRPLNLLGFFATFGVATAWGVLRYAPEQLGTTQPFLIAFFLLFLLASLFYALRHGQGARKAVDATLIFGVPIVAFGLQAGLMRDAPYGSAFSALAVGALYLALAAWLLRRRAGDAQVHRWLAECFLALAFGFVTLAVPLALDGGWTSAVWAVEGAGVYWMGRRQSRWLPRAAGLALQGLAALMYLEQRQAGVMAAWPLAHPAFLGGAMLAGAAFALAWWSRKPVAQAQSATAQSFGRFEASISPVLFWVGVLWVQGAIGGELDRWIVDANNDPQRAYTQPQRWLLQMLGWVATAFVLHRFALPQRGEPWAIAATPAWFTLPAMVVTALWAMATQAHVFTAGGWLVWPAVLALHYVMLRRLDAGPPQTWWPWVHAGGVWLAVLLAANLLVFAIGKAQLWHTAWATVMLLVAASAVLLVLARRRWFEAAPQALGWPLDRFRAAYLWHAAAPLAAGLAVGALIVAVHSNGNARPLPYLPLLNPTDLSVALALAACAAWLLRIRRGGALPVAGWSRGTVPAAALAAIAFVAINTVWLRIAHHYAGVPWDARALFASFLVQAGYSILWTLIALVLMVAAHRRQLRTPWMLGAGLLGLTMLKLFVIDLSNRGGSERIVVFIAVGLLMLVVGWFAPLPPARKAAPPAAAQDLQEAGA